MSNDTPSLDPIQLEIIANGLRSIADECFAALMRSSYSTNIKERKELDISMMPGGLSDALSIEEFSSLVAFLASQKG